MALQCGFEPIGQNVKGGRMYYAKWQNVLCKVAECTMQSGRMYYAHLTPFVRRVLTPFVKSQKKNGVLTRLRIVYYCTALKRILTISGSFLKILNGVSKPFVKIFVDLTPFIFFQVFLSYLKIYDRWRSDAAKKK